MNTVSFSLNQDEVAADRTAVAAVNFCALWPTAKPILQQLASVISSTMVKFAINTVITAGDAYCGSGDRLAAAGVNVPAGAPAALREQLSGLSDAELATLAGVQRKIAGSPPIANDVGTYVF